MIALYLSTRTAHFICRYVWRYHMGPFIDKLFSSQHQSGSSSKKEKAPSPTKAVIGTVTSREFGKLRGDRIIAIDEDVSPTTSEKSEVIVVQPKPGTVKFRKFLKQSTSVVLMMLSSSQIIYSYVAEPDTLAVFFFRPSYLW